MIHLSSHDRRGNCNSIAGQVHAVNCVVGISHALLPAGQRRLYRPVMGVGPLRCGHGNGLTSTAHQVSDLYVPHTHMPFGVALC